MPDYYDTLGPEVGAVATLAGFPPDPEQQMLLDHSNGFDKAGKSVAFEVVVIAPRQNLKTGFFKQQALGDLFVRRERLVVWSAHEFDTAQEALTDLEALIDGSDVLRSRVDKITHGAVPEIQLTPKWGRARMKFKTRTSGGGRGLSGRKVNLDEGYAVQPGQVGALYPIMLAQPDPQVRVGSSACRPESAVLWDMVQRGRAGGQARMFFAEWCGPPPGTACAQGDACDHGRETPGCGCDKPELIEQVHSAIRRGRILLQTVIDLRTSMPPLEYGREIMGWHDEVVTGGDPAIDGQAWADALDPDATAELFPAFGVDVFRSKDQVFASIGAAGVTDDGRNVLDLIVRGTGTGWVLDRCRELAKKQPLAEFVIDGAGPASSLIEPFTEAGLNVHVASSQEIAHVCGALVDALNEKSAVHGPQPDLDLAAMSARKRPRGDAFVFTRAKSLSDITPLYAVTLAFLLSDAANYDVLDSVL